MIQNSSMNIGDLFNHGISQISEVGQSLKTKIMSLEGKKLSQEEMLSIQFEMGQYNSLLEAFSTITKSMTDEVKSLAQRAS